MAEVQIVNLRLVVSGLVPKPSIPKIKEQKSIANQKDKTVSLSMVRFEMLLFLTEKNATRGPIFGPRNCYPRRYYNRGFARF